MRPRPSTAPLVALALIVGGSILSSPARAQSDLRVPILVRETAGVARRADPVTVGVPLPLAADVRDADSLVVRDAGGAGIPSQSRVLSRWNGPPDDETLPIRWAAVHFQADLPANGSGRYELGLGAPPPQRPALSRATDRGVSVDTGALAFEVAEERFRVLENVRIDLDGDGEVDFDVVAPRHGGGLVLERTDGSRYTPEDEGPVSIRIEDNGPLTTIVRIDGRHPTATANGVQMREGREPHPWLDFTARIQAFRGHPWVRLTYTVRNPDRFRTGYHNQGGDPVFHAFESLSLALPLRTMGDPLTLTLGGEAVAPRAPASASPPATAAPAWRLPLSPGSTARLYQDSSGTPAWQGPEEGGPGFRGYIASVDQERLGRGHHAAGWGDVSALAWGMTAGIDDFWQNWPKGLRFTGQGQLLIDLWPDSPAGSHRLEGGRQKTHDVFLDFHRGAGADVASFSSFASPLRATVPPSWYRDTLAMGPVAVIPTEADEDGWRLRGTANALLDPVDGIEAERERFDLYGWRDFGDSYRAGSPEHPAFGNNELDFGWGLLTLYLMGPEQEPRFLEAAAPILRHLADIDIYHTDEDAEAYSHGIRQHDGSGTVGHARQPILSHAWIRGLITWYWISGDPAALDAAREVGTWIEALVDPRSGELSWHGQSRSQAWAALALTELWEATGEVRYLDLSSRLLHAEVVADQAAASTLPCANLDWEGDAGDPDRDSTSPWQNGYVAEALGRHAFARRIAGAPDAEIERALFRLLDDLQRCGYATHDNGLFDSADSERDDEIYGRRYQSLVLDRIHPDGSYTIAYPNNHLLTDGFAYGALFTADAGRRRDWLAMARETWRWTMGPESRPGDVRSEPGYCCPETPAKNAAMSLRFGHVWRWVTQRLESAESTP